MKPLIRSLRIICTAALTLVSSEAGAELLYATNGSTISRFDSDSLGSVTTVPVTGLQGGETLIGIDVRPAGGGFLYAIGSTSRLYTVNPLTGLTAQVGNAGEFSLNGTAFGLDFNPVPDRIRLVSNTEQSLRINPNDGTLSAADTNLNPAGNIVGVAYDRNFAGTTQTTLFGIDSAAGTLVRIGGVSGVPSPNQGAVTTIGSLGLGTNLNENIGFDISGLSGIGFASITVGGQSRLYTINLSTGAATNLGAIGTGATQFLGLTAATAVPEPSSAMLMSCAAVFVFSAQRRRRQS
jgi:hypothetical protein